MSASNTGAAEPRTGTIVQDSRRKSFNNEEKTQHFQPIASKSYAKNEFLPFS